MATAMERKFTGVRKRLDQLGYRQPLGVESLPLVERLLADLLHTSESLKNSKLQIAKNKEQKGLWQQHVQPYRHDNARLTQENLELHQKLLKMKETSENRNKDLKIALRRLEHENTDLKFLNTQYMQRLLAQEKESQAKSEKILELQEKNLQAVIHTPGGRKKHIPFRRQRMDIDDTLPNNPSNPTSSFRRGPSAATTPEPYVADLLKVADENVSRLKNEISKKEETNKQLLDSIEDFKKQVDRREKEIERLSSQLRGGRPPEALAMEGKIDGNERMVAHLNIQVDFLQKANQELERQLTEERENSVKLRTRVDDLSSKNSHICTELQEIGELVKEMERERGESEGKLKEEINEWKKKIKELKEQQRVREEEPTCKMKAHEELLADNRKMAKLLATSQDDSEEVARLIETLSVENRLMKKQLYQTKESERRLREKVSKLESSKGTSHVGVVKPQSMGELHRIQKERDELRETIQEIETQLLQIQEEGKSLAQDRDNFKLLYQQVNEELNRTRVESKGTRTPHQLQRLQRERDDARLEIQQLKQECESLRERLRLAREGREREQEEETETVTTLSQELEEVTLERDGFKKRVQSLQDMVHHLEEELQQSRTSLSVALDEGRGLKTKLQTLQGLVDAGERTRSEQQRGLQEQTLHTETAHVEIARLKALVHQLEGEVREGKEKEREVTESLRQLDQEQDELREECDKKDEDIDRLRKELEKLSKECGQFKFQVGKLSSVESTAQSHLQAKEKEVGSLRQRLAAKEEEFNRLGTERAGLESHLTQLREDLTTMTQENQAVHIELRKVVEERDRMREKMEEYERNTLKYEEILSTKEQERAGLMESYRCLSEEAERLDYNVKYSKEQESSWQLELSALQKEKQHLEELCQQQGTEIEQHVNTLQSYEVQLSNLTNAMSRMEQSLRQEQEEKKALLIDLSSVRELCVQIERTKESLSRQLASQSISHDQTCSEVADLLAERDLLKQQLTSEQRKAESLETLLSLQRKKEFQSQVSDQERDVEIQHLKQQIARLENDNISHREQVQKLRGDASVKGEELERMKAELTAEKFQKEHVQEQVKKLRMAVGGAVPHKTTPSSIRTPLSPNRQHNASPLSKQQPLDDAIERSKENISSESARLVNQLMISSSSSTD